MLEPLAKQLGKTRQHCCNKTNKTIYIKSACHARYFTSTHQFFPFLVALDLSPPQKKTPFPGAAPHHIAHATRHRSQLAISCLYLEGSSFRHRFSRSSPAPKRTPSSSKPSRLSGGKSVLVNQGNDLFLFGKSSILRFRSFFRAQLTF